MQESTRERLFIPCAWFFIDLLTPAAVLLLPTLQESRRTSSCIHEEYVIFGEPHGYQLLFSLSCPGTGARDKIWRGDRYKIAQKIFCRKNRVTCLLRPRPLRAYVATCLCTSNYYVQTCLSSFYYYMPKCLYVTSCLRALNCYVPTCPSVFFYYVPIHAYVPACLSALNYYVLTRLRALNYYEPTCPHFSCAFICLRANIYFSCLRTFVS